MKVSLQPYLGDPSIRETLLSLMNAPLLLPSHKACLFLWLKWEVIGSTSIRNTDWYSTLKIRDTASLIWRLYTKKIRVALLGIFLQILNLNFFKLWSICVKKGIKIWSWLWLWSSRCYSPLFLRCRRQLQVAYYPKKIGSYGRSPCVPSAKTSSPMWRCSTP